MENIALHPSPVLRGCKYGIQFEDDPAIYVSPAVYSLFKTDPDAVLKNFCVREIRKTDKEYRLRKKTLTR